MEEGEGRGGVRREGGGSGGGGGEKKEEEDRVEKDGGGGGIRMHLPSQGEGRVGREKGKKRKWVVR